MCFASPESRGGDTWIIENFKSKNQIALQIACWSLRHLPIFPMLKLHSYLCSCQLERNYTCIFIRQSNILSVGFSNTSFCSSCAVYRISKNKSFYMIIKLNKIFSFVNIKNILFASSLINVPYIKLLF